MWYNISIFSGSGVPAHAILIHRRGRMKGRSGHG
nr:MAG TPA: hypothetical protein [Caudoviricetes sp.]